MLHPPSLWKNALALAAGLLCTAQAAAQCAGVVLEPGQPAAQVVALSGRGETRPAGAAPWQPAALSQTLGAGADMRTLALSSAALLLADRTQIRMAAQAQLRLCESRPARTLLELVGGRLWARTKKTPAALELQTPAALAVVRGTDWDVEVEEGGRTTLTVLSGRIAVSNALGAVDVGPSEQATVEPGQAPVKRLLVQPRERVQWVQALTAQPLRHIDGSAVPAPLQSAWQALQRGDSAAVQATLGTEANAWADVLRAADHTQAGCVLLDLRMDGMSGLQVFDALRERNAVLKTVFLSAHGELASAVTAVKQGAVDWLEKPCDEQTLLAAVLRAANLSLEDAQRAQRRNTLRERWNTLSPRQQEVARLLATGISSKEVARALAQRDPERPIDPRTVDTHRSAIFLKLDIRSSHELGMLVEDLGLAENTLRTL